MIIVLNKDTAAPARCADCGASLMPWGYARVRVVRGSDGTRSRVRPRRVRCSGCRVTHVLLPAELIARRADSAAYVVPSALFAAANGSGHRAIAARLDRPAGTVRGWLRRARANAEAVRVTAIRFAVRFDPLLEPPGPARDPLADALDALGQAIAATRRRLGPIGSPIALAMSLAAGFLTPRRT